MKTARTFRLAAAWVLIGTGTLAVAEYKHEIDSVHSSVVFKVRNQEVCHVVGMFEDLSGTITVDELKNATSIRVDASVAAKSINTNHKKRDQHLLSKDFLNSKKHRTITFTMKEPAKIEEGKAELKGELSLLGVTKEISAPFQVMGQVSPKALTYRFGGEAIFTIKRSEFGMDYGLPGIADEVTVIVNVAAQYELPPAG